MMTHSGHYLYPVMMNVSFDSNIQTSRCLNVQPDKYCDREYSDKVKIAHNFPRENHRNTTITFP
jgi:hypothetical protein